MKRCVILVFLKGMYLILTGQYKNPKDKIGESIYLEKSKKTYTVFKQTAVKNVSNENGTYFFVEFEFKKWVLNIFAPTIPFFLGMPGFRSKLWLVDEKTGVFAGRYVYATCKDAEGYGHSIAQKLVKSLCVPEKHNWWVEKIS